MSIKPMLKLVLFFWGICSIISLQAKVTENNLFPLSIGNKYIYLKVHVNLAWGATNGPHYYSLDTITVTNSIKYNNVEYFTFWDGWYGYNESDTSIYSLYVYGNPPQYNSSLYQKLNPLGPFGNHNILGGSYAGYSYSFTQFSGPGSMAGITRCFFPNIGFGYEGVSFRSSHGGYDSYTTLIGMISADPNNQFTLQDETAPIVEAAKTGLLQNNKLKISSIIKHKFTYKTDLSQNITQGCSFIKNATFEYFYKKDNIELPHTVANLTMDSEIDYSHLIDLNFDLINNGYDIYYKIVATDKALNPHVTNFPTEGYEKLNINLNGFFNIHYYPLQVGNYWLYDKYNYNNNTHQFEYFTRITVSVVGDTVMDNNKKYFIIQNGDLREYERIDTLTGEVYSYSKDNNNMPVENLICNIAAQNGSVHNFKRTTYPGNYTTYIDTSSIFNISNLESKTFVYNSDASISFRLIENIGKVYDYSKEQSSSTTTYKTQLSLAYAKIGENTYGHTLLPASILNRHPLHINDQYVYELKPKTAGAFAPDTIITTIKAEEVLNNGKKYFKVESSEGNSYLRIDSLHGKVYEADLTTTPTSEVVIDDLLANYHQTANIYYNHEYNNFVYYLSSLVHPLTNSGSEIFKVVQLNNSQNYFYRCSNIGIVLAYFKRESDNEYVIYNLLSYSILNGSDDSTEIIPLAFNLSQNYPNPFNPSTTINFSIKEAGLVTLKVYDILGREVTTLVNENLSEGIYNKVFSASGLSSGIYFYSLKAGKFSETKKMLLIK